MSLAAVRASGYMTALQTLLRVMLLTLLCYLLQTSVVPHLKIYDVMPNLLMLCIAVLTVSKGKKYAFAAGAAIGILLETMAANLSLFNLLIYPALALLAAQAFSDMSELKRELLRIKIAQRQAEHGAGTVLAPGRKRRFALRLRRRTADDLDPHLRILLNTLLLTVLYEFIMIAYIALGGVAITWQHVGRVSRTLLYTAAACVLMFPARAFLGMYKRRQGKSDKVLGDQVTISDKNLQSISLEPDMPSVSAVVAGQVSMEEMLPPSDQTMSDSDVTDPVPKEEPDEV